MFTAEFTTRPLSVRESIVALFHSTLARRLTYPHGPNRFIELFDPTAISDETVGTMTAIDHPTERSVRIHVRPNARWQGFVAGQYVELAVEINGRRQRRMFSPAGSQYASDALEFTMAVNPEGRLTRHLKRDAKVGDRVILGAADGAFHLPSERPSHVVLISAGSGITPLMAMLRTIVDEYHSGEIDFIHYARSADERLYGAALDRLTEVLPRLRIHNIYTRTGGKRFSADQLRQLVPGYAQAQTFVCGPAALLAATRDFFDAQGLSDRLHQEAFGTGQTEMTDQAEGVTHFRRSERRSANQGSTLLEQAERAGLNPTHGCRMGVCYACSCRKIQGQVRDLRTGEISPDGDADIQICVSVPVGSVTVDL